LPVWINTIGDKENISYYMSFFILSTPLGVIVGYILTAVVISEGSWQWAFYVMSVNMLLLTCAMACFSKNYINYDLMLKQYSRLRKRRARALYRGINLENAQTGINEDEQ
jgi:MFS family permease